MCLPVPAKVLIPHSPGCPRQPQAGFDMMRLAGHSGLQDYAISCYTVRGQRILPWSEPLVLRV
jgi:hypothetical protein